MIPKSVAISDLRIGSRQFLSIRGFLAITIYFFGSLMIWPSSVALPPLSPCRILDTPTWIVVPTDLPQTRGRSSSLVL